MKKEDRWSIGKAWLIIAVFLSYFTSSSFFLHSHTIDGVTVVHSHFHKEKHHSGQTGNHTSQDLVLISLLSHFDKPVAGIINFPVFQLAACSFLEFPDLVPGVPSASGNPASLRAPPAA
jgi:hypothetical protein